MHKKKKITFQVFRDSVVLQNIYWDFFHLEVLISHTIAVLIQLTKTFSARCYHCCGTQNITQKMLRNKKQKNISF